jgi:hypothetical protein
MDIPKPIRTTTAPKIMLLRLAFIVPLKPRTYGEINNQIPTRIWKIIQPIRFLIIRCHLLPSHSISFSNFIMDSILPVVKKRIPFNPVDV